MQQEPQPLRTDPTLAVDAPAPEPEPKPDPLSLLAVDANELARAIWSGRGDDVSRLVADLLRNRHAA